MSREVMGMSDNCIFCGSDNTTRHEEVQTFTYGDSASGPTVEVSANVIISGCIDCGEQWTKGDQEQVRSDAAAGALYVRITEFVALVREMREAVNEYADSFGIGVIIPDYKEIKVMNLRKLISKADKMVSEVQ